MIKNFFKKNSKSTEELVEHNDERVALTALLIKIAKSDYEYSSLEKSSIKIILKKRFSISELEVTDLITKAELLEDESSDSVRFTKVIKEFVPLEKRNEIIEIFWELVLADGIREDDENSLLRILGSLLGVNDRDVAFARQNV
ncbi:MAG: TerB family tellurite resistance protein, partial [Rhodobacteraceae bacterium]|nr:TerB family tellurite resistance protein [Paracoccaceae bacterium]